MAKGIPVIGRAPDKKAKIINVDELGNLKVSQLESKLDGIENKLVALEQKLTDGSQKVTLSGTDVVIGLLADRPPASEMRGRGYYAWDETDGHKLKYSDGTDWVVNQ
ncbi:hypothetical protein [Candidatus Darwinibacter acetoxidans]